MKIKGIRIRTGAAVVLAACLSLFFLSPAGADIVAPFADSGASLVSAAQSTVAWGDYDNDGDLDLAVCGWTGEGSVTRLYANQGDGTFAEEENAVLPGAHLGRLVWADVDNDGDLDLLITGGGPDGYVTALMLNTGGGFFTEKADAGLPAAHYSSTAFGDVDNDGDLDLVICGYTGEVVTALFLNDGTGCFVQSMQALPAVYSGAVAFADCNADGNLDLALCGFDGTNAITVIFLGNGDGTFVESAYAAQAPAGVFSGALAWGDYDNDGDLDLVVAGADVPAEVDADPAISTTLYVNDGMGAFTASLSAGLPGVVYGALAWGDCDNDGDLDLFISGYPGEPALSAITPVATFIGDVYRNNGDGTFSALGAGLPATIVGSAAWGDYDNDGDLDIAVTGYDGESYLTEVWKGTEADADGGNNPNAAPAAPDGLTLEWGSAILKWNAATDDTTPAAGLYYNIRVGTVSSESILTVRGSSADEIVSGVYGSPLLGSFVRPTLSSTQLGRRIVGLPVGDYRWSVRTIDAGLRASDWSDEATFSLYRIAGTVTMNGGAASVTDVVLTLSGDRSMTTSPAEDGTYSFEPLPPGNYTVTATLAGYVLYPADRTYTPLAANEEGQDFAAFKLYAITGTVTAAAGGALTGTKLTYTGTYNGGVAYSSQITNGGGGVYTVQVPYGWTGTVVPSKNKYLFAPASRSYTNVTADDGGEDYVGTSTAAPLVIGRKGTGTTGGTTTTTVIRRPRR